MTRTPILVLLSLCALAATLWFAFGYQPELAPEDRPERNGTATNTDGPRTPSGVQETPERGGQSRAADRTELESSDGSDAPQGVTGAILSPTGVPLPNVPVYLIEGWKHNVPARHAARRAGVRFPPTAETVTDARGLFSLGLRQVVANKSFELRVVSDAFADLTIPDIDIQPGDWFDIGERTLNYGVVVRGRVTAEGSLLPIAGASVTLRKSNSLDLVVVPGREGGLSAVTDAQGIYEIPNAAGAIVDMIAMAPGFARTHRGQVKLTTGQVNVLDFELTTGSALEGRVENPQGQPIHGATVIAHSMAPGPSTPAESTTDETGRFRLESLRKGTYTLLVTAPNHQLQRVSPVATTEAARTIVLAPKGSAEVRVLDPRGRAVTSYRLGIRRSFPQNEHLAFVNGIMDRQIGPDDVNRGAARIDGLDNGYYLFEVTVRGYATSRSQPFRIHPDTPRPRVDVTLSPGATLIGFVVDNAGNPVAQAAVATEPNGHSDNSFARMIGASVPDRITRVKTRTDDQGRFELRALAQASYQLRVTSDGFCQEVVTGIRIEDEKPIDLPRIALRAGTIVVGVASHAGSPQGQIKVVLGIPAAAAGKAAAAPSTFTSTFGISNNQGSFRLGERVPPGTYELKAARQTSGDPFGTILDFKQSIRTVVVPSGTEQLRLDINIPAY